MGHSLTLKTSEGQALLSFLVGAGVKVPAKLGARDLGGNQRATIMRKIDRFMDALKKVSPLYADEGVTAFGPVEHWKKESEEKYSIVDKKSVVVLDLTGQEREGLFWLLVLMAHSESEYFQPTGVQSILVWPIADKIDRTRALEEEIGLTKGEEIRVKDDAEYVHEEEAKLAKEAKA